MPEVNVSENLSDKLSSRKFWAYILYSLINLIVALKGGINVQEAMANYMWVTCFYILGQGVADLLKSGKLLEMVKAAAVSIGDLKKVAEDIKSGNGNGKEE